VTAQSNRMDADDEELRVALEGANIPTLLMVLAHLTGSHTWLEEPYRPDRTKALDDNDTAGLPASRQAEVRAAAWEVLLQWRAGRIPTPAPPNDQQIVEMLSVCMGEPVPAEYGPMMAEEAGFRRRDAGWTDGPPRHRPADFRVVVIGAGISGICAAIKLRELGISHVVLEKNDEVGGTWSENDYPGAGVDTPSHLYSFSFDPNPSWSRYYAKQDEILGYLAGVAERHQILGGIRFGTEVVSATYDAAAHRWEVVARGSDGTTLTYLADVVISSVGQLNRPQIPAVPGLETFPGPAFHSAHWRHDVDLAGKRVGVVGTGASAMQVVPEIAGTPAELVVFQRSPQWVAPNANYLRSVPEATRLLMDQVPYYATWYRMRLLWMFNDKLHPSLQVDPDWPHPERAVNATNDKHRQFFTGYIREQIAGREDLWDKVLPSYPPYGKRILMDNNWYRTIARDDVRLVADDVKRIDGDTVVTADGGRHQLDVLVFATGFQSKRMLWPMEVRGVGGQSLREVWGEDDARAYLGMTVPGFPNLFLLYGPNTNLGHGGSVIFHTECQVNYVTRLLVAMIEQDIAAIDCRPEVFEEYNARVDAAHEQMIWTHRGMDTWYRNARGRVVTNTPWRLLDYWRMTRRPALEDFAVSSGMDARERRPA
jgi:4-hydroxyacetophenone monooxygenase